MIIARKMIVLSSGVLICLMIYLPIKDHTSAITHKRGIIQIWSLLRNH